MLNGNKKTNTELFLFLHFLKTAQQVTRNVLLCGRTYGECARCFDSKFDVGRSMFDGHSVSSIKTI